MIRVHVGCSWEIPIVLPTSTCMCSHTHTRVDTCLPSSLLLWLYQHMWILQQPFVFGTLLYCSSPPTGEQTASTQRGPRGGNPRSAHVHTHFPPTPPSHLVRFIRTLEVWIPAEWGGSERGDDANGKTVDRSRAVNVWRWSGRSWHN